MLFMRTLYVIREYTIIVIDVNIITLTRIIQRLLTIIHMGKHKTKTLQGKTYDQNRKAKIVIVKIHKKRKRHNFHCNKIDSS